MDQALLYVFNEDNHILSKKKVDFILNPWVFGSMTLLFGVWSMINAGTEANAMEYYVFTAIAKTCILVLYAHSVCTTDFNPFCP